MAVYYNEIDPKAAAWLRELIAQGHIADGIVDERSIRDVRPSDLRGFTQHHFFAGIGVWPHALRLAGWPDNRPVWTGSCPCQPFSAAGRGRGFEDERHLWPVWFDLIRQCRPDVVLGEQVASKDGLAWLDAVYADMEGADYAGGALDLCAAGFGAPHIRQRLDFVWLQHAARNGRFEGRPESGERGAIERRGDDRLAVADGRHPGAERQQRGGQQRGGQQRLFAQDGGAGERMGVADGAEPQSGRQGSEALGHGRSAIAAGGVDRLDDNHDARPQGHAGHDGAAPGREGPRRPVAASGISDGVADAAGEQRDARWLGTARDEQRPLIGPARHGAVDGRADVESDAAIARGTGRPGPTNGRWADADWLFCRDGRWRPVEPGTFPLAYGTPARVGRLRGYGNAVVVGQTIEFIEAILAEIGGPGAVLDVRLDVDLFA